MTKLEKSVRRELKYYGPALRNGHYGGTHRVGVIPEDYQCLELACCDVEDGIVVDIRIYGYSDLKTRRDYYGESIDITTPIVEYLDQTYHQTWDDLIKDIVDEIKNAIIAEQED